jgi:hypothetical protein
VGAAAPTERIVLGSAATLTREKIPGRYSILLGLVFVLPLWLFPGVSLFGRLALTMLGAAVLAGGIGRLRVEAQRRPARRRPEILEPPERMAEGVASLGSLHAVFRTASSRATNALAIALLGLAFGFGTGFLVDLLREGIVSVKLMLAIVAAPCMAVYLLYRAVRHYVDSWCVLIFAEGLVCLHGRRIEVHFREAIAWISQVEIGNAIDERAVDIQLKHSKEPLGFTCSHFRNLDHFADRA